MNYLKNKTILFLSPRFFGYEFEIKKELENFGAKVMYFDDRPKNDFFTKAFIRLNFKYFISKKIENYYKNIKKEIEYIELDYIFLLNVETVPLEFIQKIKNINSDVKIVTYFWDSLNNRKYSLKYLKYSDSFFSFDSNDINLNKKIKFLSLFYIKDYENIVSTKDDLVYDVVFIGTVHSDRYKIIKEIEKQLIELKLNLFFYFYSPSKILFFFQKLFKKNFKLIKWKDVSFQSLNKSNIIDIIKKSKSIIDIQHPFQKGLTMRTIEILGANKKLLTTNKEVIKYDFYNQNNIFILDRNNPKIEFDFLVKNYEKIDNKIYEKYSISSWIETIFKGIDE